MPSATATTQSITTTLIILAILILSFFPGLFHYLWTAPLTVITWLLTPSPSSIAVTPWPPNPATTCICNPPHTSTAEMSWFQKSLTLPSRSRGSYLITDEILSQLPELSSYKVGLLHLFIQHTSCALSLNENWDADVRADMSDALDRIVPR
jgi:hypothetical protein